MESLIPKPTYPWGKLKLPIEDVKHVLFVTLGLIALFFGIFMLAYYENKLDIFHAPDIIMHSMDFTVLNMTEPPSLKWDLSIMIFPKHFGDYVCLEGDFKVFIVYKDVTIATSSSLIERSPSLRYKLLTASLTASLGDMDGAIVENILDEIKAKGEMRFGSRLLLPSCRTETSGMMNYACDEAKLRFEPGSQESTATLFRSVPICHYFS